MNGEAMKKSNLHGLLDQGVENVDDKREEHQGEGVTLAQPTSKRNGVPRNSVDKHASGVRGEQDGNPRA